MKNKITRQMLYCFVNIWASDFYQQSVFFLQDHHCDFREIRDTTSVNG